MERVSVLLTKLAIYRDDLAECEAEIAALGPGFPVGRMRVGERRRATRRAIRALVTELESRGVAPERIAAASTPPSLV